MFAEDSAYALDFQRDRDCEPGRAEKAKRLTPDAEHATQPSKTVLRCLCAFMIGISSRILVFILALSFATVVGSQGQSPERKSEAVSFNIAPTPDWVKQVTAPNEDAMGSESAGTAYLLVDEQENLERSASYYHQVRKITSENGVQNGASMSISFNPAFEKLIFHSIQLTRNGVPSNRLDRSHIKLLQREENTDRFIYDPSYNAQIALDDVRVGDVIDISYTVEGANPLRQGKYSVIFSMQWSVPVVRNFLRLVYPSNRNLGFQAQNDTTRPTISAANGITEWSYEAANIPGRKVEDDAPDDYSPTRRLEISEFHDWAELAQWAMPLFETEAPRSSEFDAEIDKLKAIINPELRVVAALRFVQDEIRYVALKFGPGARRPTALGEVLRRRFADNKDKVLLLVTLLRRIGIDAAPALVSDSYRSTVRDELPAPEIFDHAIVQVRLGETTHWIDPTRSGQRGPLSQVFVTNYGYALVLRPGSKELTAFTTPPGSWPVKKVVETYRVRAPEKSAELDVISEYRGLAADKTRTLFLESAREEIQKQYLQYYARTYPELKTQKQLWYEELPAENACRVTESYVLPKIWELSEQKDHYELFLRPGDIQSAIGSPTSPQRDDPLKLEHPNTVVEEMNIEMFEDWSFQSKGDTVSTDFFRFRDDPTATGSHIQFNYSYETLKGRVEVGELPKFNEAITKIKDTLGYTLKYSTPEQLKKTRRRGTFNWAVAAAAICFSGTAGFIAYRYFRDSRLPNPVPPPIDAPARLNGIGGWLILLAIGHLLRPIGFIKTGFDLLPTMLNTNSWRSLTDPIESTYHAWWAPVLLFELFFTIVLLVFCALLIALFFTKKAAWPRCFAVFLICSFLGTALDIYFVHRIPAAAESISGSLRDILTITVGAAIWIPYVYLSKRVKATFRY
ncbi:MAG: hypothetical protein QOE73_1066 [Verrucomicrobiota bacterium]